MKAYTLPYVKYGMENGQWKFAVMNQGTQTKPL